MGNWNWINSVQCFHNVQLGKDISSYSDYTWGYCTGNLFIMITSYLSFAACVLLLSLQM